MKIIHICLACTYIEGWGYQENILPNMHAEWGNKVTVLTSDYAFNTKSERTVKMDESYINDYGVYVKVLERRKILGKYLFRYFKGLYEELNKISPDIIFVHGGQFLSLKDVVKYCKENRKVKLYIDQHGDYYNMPVNSMRSKFIQKYIYGYWIRKSIKYVRKFWGVTPWRCEFLNEVYGIPQSKIELLVMGGEDKKIHFDQMPYLKNDIRKKLGIEDDDFVIVTGGKIDKKKNIHILMKVISKFNENVKLIIFGEPTDDIKEEFLELLKYKNIIHIGWINSDSVYDYFLSSDLAVFPGTHSVLWEQACACGTPCIFKDWTGMHHVDLGGNCLFIKDENIELELTKLLKEVMTNNHLYNSLKSNAVKKGIPTFSYNNIAKKSIEL